MRNLTALYQFAAAKREELRRDDSQAAFSFADAFSQWNALADADRKRWEQKATEAQERYLSECMKRSASAVEGDAEADGDGDAEGDSDGEGDDDAAAKRDPRDDADGEMLKLELPQSRVTKVVRCNKDVGKISRDANFLIAKAAEFFLERRVSETALETARQHRKIILLRDFIAALSLNKNPQALQVFIGAHARRTPPKRACVR
uniref:HMG box domain-containing protein n=1 Tax=Chrysotila carterae TaxID=13221 RepID=A0A7S4F5T9_CHRCT